MIPSFVTQVPEALVLVDRPPRDPHHVHVGAGDQVQRGPQLVLAGPCKPIASDRPPARPPAEHGDPVHRQPEGPVAAVELDRPETDPAHLERLGRRSRRSRRRGVGRRGCAATNARSRAPAPRPRTTTAPPSSAPSHGPLGRRSPRAGPPAGPRSRARGRLRAHAGQRARVTDTTPLSPSLRSTVGAEARPPPGGSTTGPGRPDSDAPAARDRRRRRHHPSRLPAQIAGAEPTRSLLVDHLRLPAGPGPALPEQGGEGGEAQHEFVVAGHRTRATVVGDEHVLPVQDVLTAEPHVGHRGQALSGGRRPRRRPHAGLSRRRPGPGSGTTSRPSSGSSRQASRQSRDGGHGTRRRCPAPTPPASPAAPLSSCPGSETAPGAVARQSGRPRPGGRQPWDPLRRDRPPRPPVAGRAASPWPAPRRRPAPRRAWPGPPSDPGRPGPRRTRGPLAVAAMLGGRRRPPRPVRPRRGHPASRRRTAATSAVGPHLPAGGEGVGMEGRVACGGQPLAGQPSSGPAKRAIGLVAGRRPRWSPVRATTAGRSSVVGWRIRSSFINST